MPQTGSHCLQISQELIPPHKTGNAGLSKGTLVPVRICQGTRIGSKTTQCAEYIRVIRQKEDTREVTKENGGV